MNAIERGYKTWLPIKEDPIFCIIAYLGCSHQHPTDEVSGYAQKLHPFIAQKVSEFVSESMTDVHEVKRHSGSMYTQSFHNSTSASHCLQIVPSTQVYIISGTMYTKPKKF